MVTLVTSLTEGYKFNRRLNSVNLKVAIAALVYGTKVKHYACKVSVNN